MVDPADYAVVLDELAANGETSYETRQRLAAKVFRHTAAYDALIAEYFTAQVGETNLKTHFDLMTLSNQCVTVKTLNKTQTSTKKVCQRLTPLLQLNSLTGKELSFNNIRDADAAIRIIRDFKDRPTVVALKHMNHVVSVKLMTLKQLGTTLMKLTQCQSLVVL